MKVNEFLMSSFLKSKLIDEETAKKAYDDMVKSGLAKQIYLTSIYNNRRD